MGERIDRGMAYFFSILFGCIMCITIFLLILVDKNIIYSELCMVETLLPNFALAVIWVFLIIACCFLCNFAVRFGKIQKFTEKYFYLLLVLASLAVLYIQWQIAYEIYFFAGWDVSIVMGSADKVQFGTEPIGNFYYFSQYTNNIGIAYLLAVIQKAACALGYETERYYICIKIGCALINLAGVFTVLAVKKITKSIKASVTAFVLFHLLVSTNPWMSVPYTDVFSILFPVLTFYFYVQAVQKAGSRYSPLLWLGIGLSGGIGYLIKPSGAIVLIAVVVCAGIRWLTGERSRKIYGLKCMVMFFAAIFMVYGIYVHMLSYTGCELNKDIAFSWTHYFMMGLNEETTGSYLSADYGYSSSFATAAERTKGNMERAFSRLNDFGLPGYLKFLMNKLLMNFNDGTFAWGLEGGFVLGETAYAPGIWGQRLRRLYYVTNDWYIYYATAAQSIWLWVQMTAAGILLGSRKKQEQSVDRKLAEKVLMVSLIGIFAFVMLFEARARYLYNMLPLYVICAVLGGQNIYRWLIQQRRKIRCHNDKVR